MERAAEACRAGNLEYISTVRDLQRLVERTDEDGRSLLHAAASSGSAPLLDFLVSQGAGPMVNRQDEEVRHPRITAHCSGVHIATVIRSGKGAAPGATRVE